MQAGRARRGPTIYGGGAPRTSQCRLKKTPANPYIRAGPERDGRPHAPLHLAHPRLPPDTECLRTAPSAPLVNDGMQIEVEMPPDALW